MYKKGCWTAAGRAVCFSSGGPCLGRASSGPALPAAGSAAAGGGSAECPPEARKTNRLSEHNICNFKSGIGDRKCEKEGQVKCDPSTNVTHPPLCP